MNVLKWAGVEFSYREAIKEFRRLCWCEAPDGCTHAPFDHALRIITGEFEPQIIVRRVHRPMLWQIEEHLRAEGAVVLNYYWRVKERSHRHWILMTDVSDSGETFQTVNDFRDGPALRRRTREKFKKQHLRFQRPDTHYKAWFISLKE
jgi:hypothetical protein